MTSPGHKPVVGLARAQRALTETRRVVEVEDVALVPFEVQWSVPQCVCFRRRTDLAK